jgi:hypothetical protein
VPIPHSIEEDKSTGYARVLGQVFLGRQREPVDHLLFVATALWVERERRHDDEHVPHLAQFRVRRPSLSGPREAYFSPQSGQLKKAIATRSVSRYGKCVVRLRGCAMVVIWICLGIGLLYLWLAGYWFGWFLAFPGFALVTQAIVENPDDTPCRMVVRFLVLLVLTGIPFIAWRWIDPREGPSFYGRGNAALL